MTNQFEQFGLEFGRCEWNNLPIELQRMYLISLSDTQQPKNIQTYSGIMCTRDTFKKVLQWQGTSYGRSSKFKHFSIVILAFR